MRSARSTLAAVAASLVSLCAGAGEVEFKSERLSKDETKALFEKLGKAAATARTFHARILRSEESGYVTDDEPLRSEGEVWAVRPDRFRQQMSKPRKSLAVVNPKEVWIYFPESREAQHVDLAKGVAGKAGASAESFMSWVTFDLAEIEKAYRVSVRTAEVPEGVTVRVAKSARDGAPAPRAAAAPAKAYRITYTPLASHRKKSAVRSLSLWVDGEHPWPLKVEKMTKSRATIVTEFRDMVLEEDLDPELFRFTPPRGTKREELSG